MEKILLPISIIIGSAIIGFFIYLSFSPKNTVQVVSTLPTSVPAAISKEEKTTPTATSSPSATTKVENDLLAIKNALALKLNVQPEDIDVTISRNIGDYVKGNVKDKGSVGGGYYLAAKASGVWKIVYDGQATPTCLQLAPYQFPNTMVAECLDTNGQIVKR